MGPDTILIFDSGEDETTNKNNKSISSDSRRASK